MNGTWNQARARDRAAVRGLGAAALIAGVTLVAACSGARAPAAPEHGVPPGVLLHEYALGLARAEHRKPDAQLLSQARQDLRQRAALVRAADAQGLQHVPQVRARLELAEQAVLIQSMLSAYLRRHPITQVDLQAHYKRFVQLYGTEEFQLAQITAPTEADARQVVRSLRAGASFDALVREAAAKGQGWRAGVLGWVRPGQIAPAFAPVIATLGVGGYNAEPVRNAFGWHVLQLQGERPVQPPSFQKVHDRLDRQMQLAQVRRYEASILRKAGVLPAAQAGSQPTSQPAPQPTLQAASQAASQAH